MPRTAAPAVPSGLTDPTTMRFATVGFTGLANVWPLGGYDTSGAQDVEVVRSIAYVASGGNGLQVLDVSDPGNIRRLGGYDTDGQALSVQVVGNLLYLADGAGLQILQMSGLPVSMPRLVLDPADQFTHLGESATFQVVAAGVEPLAYQWRKDGQALVDGDRITGATTPRLTIQTLEPADRGLYSAIVSNSYGSVTSAVALLTVNLITVDAGFDVGADNIVDSHEVYSLALQTDGKILVGGYFLTLGGQPRPNIARLNADGTLDIGFNPGPRDWFSSVRSLAVQPDGKIVVGHSDVSAYILRRLNADGSPDPAFNPVEFQPNDEVQAVALQTDGKILVGGGFTRVAGRARNGLLRLNANGTMDPTFEPVASGRDGAVFAVAVQADGKIVAGGDFSAVNGQPHQAIVRLNNTEPAAQSLSYEASAAAWQRSGTSPEVWRTTLDYSMDAVTWTSAGAGVRILGGWQWPEVTVPTNALLRARGFVAGSGISEWFVESLLPTFPQTAPAIVTDDGSLGVSCDRFNFNISGVDGQVVVIEGSSNLVRWTSLETNALSNGLFDFSDPAWLGLPFRFYRIRLWP